MVNNEIVAVCLLWICFAVGIFVCMCVCVCKQNGVF